MVPRACVTFELCVHTVVYVPSTVSRRFGAETKSTEVQTLGVGHDLACDPALKIGPGLHRSRMRLKYPNFGYSDITVIFPWNYQDTTCIFGRVTSVNCTVSSFNLLFVFHSY